MTHRRFERTLGAIFRLATYAIPYLDNYSNASALTGRWTMRQHLTDRSSENTRFENLRKRPDVRTFLHVEVASVLLITRIINFFINLHIGQLTLTLDLWNASIRRALNFPNAIWSMFAPTLIDAITTACNYLNRLFLATRLAIPCQARGKSFQLNLTNLRVA